MDLKTVVVTWMDGKVATYADATTNVINGVLHIYLHTAAGTLIPGREWHFPKENIRAWGPEPWTDNHSTPTTTTTTTTSGSRQSHGPTA